ncbi:MAG: hypothetical protein HOE97_01765 [Rhodospirillaceae bacterium]|jgi:hypothetical protein|nr:hypothetical protein [Rhodospirillaceae bacterium]
MKTYDDLINSINDNDQDEDIDQLIENTLDEGFLRLGLITSFIGKTKQYGNRVDSEVRNLNSDISSWVNNKNEDLDKKKLGEVFKTLGVVMFYQRKMMMYRSQKH